MVLTQLLGEGIELALGTRNEDNVQLLGRQLESKFLANTIRGTSDDYKVKN